MTYVLGILGCAALFVLFTALRPVRQCGGHCGACAEDCALRPREKR